MFRKIDNSNAFRIATDNYKTTISYITSVAQKDVKILRGVIFLPTSLFNNKDEFNVLCYDQIIDHIVVDSLKERVCIDVTDELQDLVNKGVGEVLQIVLSDKVINNSTDNFECHMEYQTKKLWNDNNAYQEISVNRAGSGKINLSNGGLTFSHADMKTNSKVLPISLSHTYNSFSANEEQDDVFLNSGEKIQLPKSFCGKGWKLNFQQYLVKERFNHSVIDEEVSANYTYIDAEDNHVLFQEKYYYEENGNKIYLAPNQITIKQDESLVYEKNNEEYDVLTEIVSDSDYVLQTRKEGFSNLKYIEQDIDEIEQLKSNIRDLKLNIDNLTTQKENNDKTIELYETSKEIQESSNDYQTKYIQNQKASIQYQIDNKDKQLELQNYENTYQKETCDRTYRNMYEDATDENEKKSLPKESEKKAYDNYRNEQKDIQEISNKWSYGENLDCCSGELYESLRLIIENEELQDSSNEHSKDQISAQTKQLENSNHYIDKQLEFYNVQLEKLLYQLHELEKQVPTYYLTNKEGTMFFGFAMYREESLYKLEDYKPKENTEDKLNEENETSSVDVYRLVAIGDSYENIIALNYDDEKLTSVVDADENVLTLNYNDNGMLQYIVDDRENKVAFEYDLDRMLTMISYSDGNKSLYEYNVNGKLTKVVDQSGYGVKYTYNYNQILIEELATYALIRHGKDPIYCKSNGEKQPRVRQMLDVKFYDYRTTIVSDRKGNKQTYIFDNYGRPTIVYSGDFDENKVNLTKDCSISYSYEDNKVSRTTQKLNNSKNILKVSSENYLGDEIYLGDEVYTTLFELPKDEEIYQIMPESIYQIPINASQVQLLNYGTRCYVLSAWAKADSAYITNNLEEDYQSAIDKIILNNLDGDKVNRKFELRAELQITNSNGENLSRVFKNSFDWMQTNWQYCELPIMLKDGETVLDAKLYFDYSNNTNSAKLYGVSLNEATLEASVFDKDGLLKEKINTLTKFKYSYSYDENNLLSKATLSFKGKEYNSFYTYNKNHALIRSVDHNGMVEEKEYNDKGVVIKTSTYNLADPTSKYVSTTKLDEKGKEIGTVDEFGDDDCEFEYLGKTGVISSAKDRLGNKVSYGYDPRTQELISMSASVDNEENCNIFGYTLGLSTRLSHNNFNIDFEYDGYGRQTAVVIDGVNEKYVSTQYLDDFKINTYASGESVETMTDADGKVVKINYTKAKDQSPVEMIKNEYDAHDNLTKQFECVTHEENGEEITENFVYENVYDDFGNTVYSSKSKQQNDELTKEIEVSTSYNRFNNVETSQIKIGDTTLKYNYKYDNLPENNLISLTLPNQMTQKFEYDLLGRVKEISLDDKFTKSINYVKRGEYCSDLVSSVWYGKDGVVKDNTKYSYDEKGNITKIVENGTEIARYTYDALSRLVREDNKELNKTTLFAYDNGGNIVEKFETVYTLAETDKLSKETVTEEDIARDKQEYGFSLRKLSKLTNYGYSATGWKDQLLSYGDETFEYDKLGNPIIYRNIPLKWGHLRNLEKYGDIANYAYNASGVRISKTVNSVTTKYFVSGNKILAQDDGTNKIFFHYGVDGLVGFSLNGEEFVYKKNIQNDILGIFSTNGDEIAQYKYNSLGKCVTKYLKNDGKMTTIEHDFDGSITSEINQFIAYINPFRYRSYYYDSETKLYYLNTRYYDSELGRFINADEITYLDSESFNGLNLYAYCANNPIMNVDTNGNAWWNPFSWNWKKAGNWFANIGKNIGNFFSKSLDVIGGLAASILLVGVGLAITMFSSGFFSNFGAGIIAAGVNGFLNGLQSKLAGDSFWSGYAGGVVSGLIIGLGTIFGLLGTFIGGLSGNFVGTITTDSINGINVKNSNYILNLFADSIFSGILAVGAYKFGLVTKLLNIPGYRAIFGLITVWSEFIFSAIKDTGLFLIKNLSEIFRERLNYNFRR